MGYYYLMNLLDPLCGIVFALPAVWIYNGAIRKGGWKQALLLSVLTVYLCEMFNIVGIPAIQCLTWDPSVNLIPFADFGQRAFFFGFSMNIVMFLPFGFLLPLLWKSLRSWKRAALAGFCLSLFIELSQLFCFRATDIDDLIANTLGTALGYAAARLLFRNRWNSDTAPDSGRVSPALDLAICIAIPVFVFLFLRTPLLDYLYTRFLMKV